MRLLSFFFLLISSTLAPAAEPTTQRIHLSGHGPSDAVEWDFTVSAGRRAGEQAKIPVPSQWEQHGFGGYDYGHVSLKERNKEDGLYRHQFTVPSEWKDRVIRIVFEGSMTDTTVKINGQQAGPTHQGGFYQFHYDISDKIRFGENNQLEVLVSKDSANPSVEQAERKADYWIFGGIYRPVWIEALPQNFIDWSSIDAKADGSLRARVHLGGAGEADKLVARLSTLDGKPVGGLLTAPLDGAGPIDLSGTFSQVHPWSAEDPHLYQIELTLMLDGQPLHHTTERIGFRTFEAREGKGVFVNGRRITVKGVNRHSFRPESGRSLDPEHCFEDARLLKSMNMNSVRCSHYPPDKAFLEACDELGLYVIDELCTWQKPCLDTATATRLIHQIVRRDANHPSILWWANGNEGGWNTEVDGEFPRWDIQQRPVLHPWDPFSGFQTKHYPDWGRLNKDLDGDLLVMPTELLHGLYDGGHGAGLEDYWNAITARPNGLGGFLWVMADEGIMRSDRDGAIDVWQTNAPDGIVGPHHEKEASFFTIKDIFCPVQIPMCKLPADFDGKIEVQNHYDFRDLSSVRFAWKLTGHNGFFIPGDHPSFRGKPAPLSAPPGDRTTITLPLPDNWKSYETLELTATDSDDHELWTWSWPTLDPAARADLFVKTWINGKPGEFAAPRIEEQGERLLVTTEREHQFIFDRPSGRLIHAKIGSKILPLTNGPSFVGSKPPPKTPFTPAPINKVIHRMDGNCLIIEATNPGPLEHFRWTVHPEGHLDLEYRYRLDQAAPFHGLTFDLPEEKLRSFSWLGQGPRRVWRNRMRGIRFGRFEIPFKTLQPSHQFNYPHARGYFAGIHDAEITTSSGRIQIIPHQDDTFLRLGTNDEGERIRTYWPDGDISILHGIPAIGTKFKPPEALGPQSQLNPAPGVVTGKASFRFLD